MTAKQIDKHKAASRGTTGTEAGSGSGKEAGARESERTGASRSRDRHAATGRAAVDAIALLEDDHKRVRKMFAQFDKLDPEDEQASLLVQQACAVLRVHMVIEEEIFYPSLRGEIDDEDLLDEAAVEHQAARTLMTQLESLSPDDPRFRATFCVMGEYVRHHLKEEEDEMFEQARKAKIDFAALGARMVERRDALLHEADWPGEAGRGTQDAAGTDEADTEAGVGHGRGAGSRGGHR